LTSQKTIKVILNVNDNDEIYCSAEGDRIDYFSETNAYIEGKN